jgi:hypothetical protein
LAWATSDEVPTSRLTRLSLAQGSSDQSSGSSGIMRSHPRVRASYALSDSRAAFSLVPTCQLSSSGTLAKRSRSHIQVRRTGFCPGANGRRHNNCKQKLCKIQLRLLSGLSTLHCKRTTSYCPHASAGPSDMANRYYEIYPRGFFGAHAVPPL